MNINDIYESKYIKSGDLQGREPIVTIAEANVEQIGDDRKLVLYFEGKKKGLVCNKTNANRIAHYYGPDTDHWLGKSIVLYTDLVDFQGKTTEAIRVRIPPKPTAANITTSPRRMAEVALDRQEKDGLEEVLDNDDRF